MNLISPCNIAQDPTCETITDPDLISERYPAYLTDESKLRGECPLSLSFPSSEAQLSAILAKHHSLQQQTIFSAARTGVVGGAVAVGQSHLVSLERIRGINNVNIDPVIDRPYLSVMAGTTLIEIEEFLAAHHPEFYYPVDPTCREASIGGNISTNAAGMRSYHYGATRRWVRGLTVILSNGKKVKLRRGEISAQAGGLRLNDEGATREIVCNPIPRSSTKHSIGYHFDESIDLVDLFIAAEGTLGAVTEAELYLAPRPRNRLYFLQFFHSSDSAFKFAAAIEQQPLATLALEFIDGRSLAIAATHPGRAQSKALKQIDPNTVAAVFLDIELKSQDDLEVAFNILRQAVTDVGENIDRSIAGSEDRDLVDIKTLRHAVPEMINRLVAERKSAIPRLHKYSTDMAVPKTALSELFTFYEATLGSLGLDFFIFGHFGDGHLHVNVVPKTETELDSFLATYMNLGRKVIELGGTVAGEHGIGRVKKEFLKLQFSPEHLQTMRKIRSFFDPGWLLNPGVLIDPE
jgi:D-lactate dehydrogenase (cytochrome)